MTHEPHEGECYKWFNAGTVYTNATNKFVVVIGCGIIDSDVDTDIFRIDAAGGAVIDHIIISRFDRDVTAAGATTTVTLKGLWRRMLIPPDGSLNTTNAVNASLVQCCCLEKALAIL